MNVSTYFKLEKIKEQICSDLKININDINVEYIEGTNPECFSKVQHVGENKYMIKVYTGSFTYFHETVYAVAHELRHVWQYRHGHAPTKGHTMDTYDKTYEYNICEIDANRYADIVVHGKTHKINKRYNMYFSDEELDIYCKKCIEAGVKIPA